MKFLFLIINLSLIKHGVSYLNMKCFLDDHPYYKDVIHIIQVSPGQEDSENKETIDDISRLTEKLYDKCRSFYNFKIVHVTSLKDSVDETIKMSVRKQNFINLFGHDPHLNINAGSRYWKYAGDVYNAAEILKPIVFKYKTSKDVHKTNFINSTNYTSCNSRPSDLLNQNWTVKKVPDNLPVRKIMSNKIAAINGGDLLDFVTKLHLNGDEIEFRQFCSRTSYKPEELKEVLVCYDDQEKCFHNVKPISKSLKFNFTNTATCEKTIKEQNLNLLAVLAPTPFEMDYEFKIPTVFYKSSFLYPEHKTQFPNSINLIDGSLLKYGFMKFLKDMDWRRIAVISDSRPYSDEFENDLLQHFSKEGILHNVQRCEIQSDFRKALENLAKMDARIVIANVDEINARKVFDEARNYKRFTLIYRVWPNWDTSRAKLRIFSITLGPVKLPNKPCSRDYTNEPICTGIIHSLDFIDTAYSNIQFTDGLKRADFFRKFTNNIINTVKPGVTAFVLGTKGAEEILSIMEINPLGDVKTTRLYTELNIPEDQSPCIAKTSKFEAPCDKFLLIYLMSVFILFLICVLIITCYFHHSSPIHLGSRYTQF